MNKNKMQKRQMRIPHHAARKHGLSTECLSCLFFLVLLRIMIPGKNSFSWGIILKFIIYKNKKEAKNDPL